jgi:hypothetical protein
VDWVAELAKLAHPPKRPEWSCEPCDADWPCDPVREELRAKYDVIDLAILMQALTAHVLLECPMRPEELFARFLLWTR